MTKQNQRSGIGDVLLRNVDKPKLESQRLLLGGIACDPSKCRNLSEEEVAALEGVVNMLDAWSDMERGG